MSHITLAQLREYRASLGVASAQLDLALAQADPDWDALPALIARCEQETERLQACLAHMRASRMASC